MNMLVVIKTKYAVIEQKFPNKVEAAIFLKQSLNDFEVVSYEIRTIT